MIQLVFILASTWVAVCTIDLIFQTCLLYPYIQGLKMTGITIKPFYLKCYLTQFNKLFSKWGKSFPKALKTWFDLGAILTCILIIPAVGLLLTSAVKLMFVTERAEVDAQVLQPVVPGYNLPFSQIFYYLITIFVCSVFHEMGHALAAAREGVQIEGCGFFVLFILPAAFVDLKAEQLLYSSSWQQLRIFSAGIWHNIVLASFALLLLWSNPMLLSPLFSTDNGVSVIDVAPNSGAFGPAGLFPGDQIRNVNNCRVDHMNDWKLCLQEVALNPQHGYCASRSFLEKQGIIHEFESGKDCCSNSSSQLCFQFYDTSRQAQSCLPVRRLLNEQGNKACTDNVNCGDGLCVVPVLASESEKLIRIERDRKEPVLYLGSASELFATVTVCQWVSKTSIISIHLPYVYETLLKYLASFSLALAALNLIPCPGLDGQFLCQTIIDGTAILSKRSHRAVLVFLLKIFGSVLIIANVFLGLYKLIFTN